MKTIHVKKEHIHQGDLILVNKGYPLQVEPTKEELHPIAKDSIHLLKKEVVIALHEWILGTNMEKEIVWVSGYRSKEEQECIYNGSLKENGLEFTKKYVAYPGQSEHQTGLAIDLAKNEEEIDFICPNLPYDGIFQVFRENASSYGFIERYQKGKESITNIGHEPWHFRYVGAAHARIINEHAMVLEEYIDWIKQYNLQKNPLSFEQNGKKITIGYLPMILEDEISISIQEQVTCEISGNNMDGIVVTLYES